MVATTAPRSSAGELSDHGMTPSASQLCHRSVPPVLFQVVLLKPQGSLPHAWWTG
ncbi:MAG: hypothetical protein JO161_11020 [Planctomycetaceae bacterium]|nr:hypothetical protein [Planctomycetaceae bacterium]